MMEHPQRKNMLLAADNTDQLFECDDLSYKYNIGFVLTHPQYNWRPVKTTKKIKRWLWADKNGKIAAGLFTESEIGIESRYTIKLLWSETIFEVEE